MSRRLLLVTLITSVLLLMTESFPPEASGGPEFVPHQFVVQLAKGMGDSQARGLARSVGAEVFKVITFPDGVTFVSLRLPRGRDDAHSLEALRGHPQVKAAGRNILLFALEEPAPPATFPDDPSFSQQWGMHNTGQVGGIPDSDIDAPEAWDLATASDVVVAVIDTGIQMGYTYNGQTHPDLQPNVFTNPGEVPSDGIDNDGNGYIDDVHGWDFKNEDNVVYNGIDSHGTHVAGTVGAVGNNATGVTGVAWSVPILPMKFLENNVGTLADALKAFAYAADLAIRHDLRIITSNSWGCFGSYTECDGAMFETALTATGQLHLFAAGNSATDNDGHPTLALYPASLPLDNIISVAASDLSDNLAGFSNFGAKTVDLTAPGVSILSTVPTDIAAPDPPYDTLQGTSMATPHVSGDAALAWTLWPILHCTPIPSPATTPGR